MLYAIKDTKYQGNIFNDNSKAFRESLEAEGYTVAWFDEEPDFHKEWVNTPAADGVIELELSVDQFRDFKLTKLEDATEGFEENKNSQMYFVSSIGYKFSGDRRTKDNLKERSNTLISYLLIPMELRPLNSLIMITLSAI